MVGWITKGPRYTHERAAAFELRGSGWIQTVEIRHLLSNTSQSTPQWHALHKVTFNRLIGYTIFHQRKDRDIVEAVRILEFNS